MKIQVLRPRGWGFKFKSWLGSNNLLLPVPLSLSLSLSPPPGLLLRHKVVGSVFSPLPISLWSQGGGLKCLVLFPLTLSLWVVDSVSSPSPPSLSLWVVDSVSSPSDIQRTEVLQVENTLRKQPLQRIHFVLRNFLKPKFLSRRGSQTLPLLALLWEKKRRQFTLGRIPDWDKIKNTNIGLLPQEPRNQDILRVKGKGRKKTNKQKPPRLHSQSKTAVVHFKATTSPNGPPTASRPKTKWICQSSNYTFCTTTSRLPEEIVLKRVKLQSLCCQQPGAFSCRLSLRSKWWPGSPTFGIMDDASATSASNGCFKTAGRSLCVPVSNNNNNDNNDSFCSSNS